jgi:hypothetical protein
VTLTNAVNCDSVATLVLTANVCNSIVNLKAFIQGYYVASSASMRPVLENSGVAGATSSQCDTISVEIHDGTTGNIIGTPVRTVLNTNGTAMASFPALTGSHYIVIRHRNALETWSAAPVTMGDSVSYDFTTSASQAYGNNQVSVASGVFALWSGDLNQDGAIPLILFGYERSDLTGDGVVESSDYLLMENNIPFILFTQRP